MRKTFEVFHEEYRGDDPWETQAFDHEDAAEKYAEYFDSDGDYTLLNGNTAIVRVVDASGLSMNFRVSGETIPSYSAREVKG